MNKIIEKIAAETLCIDTLETRKADHLDFHEVAVWSLKEALERAYKAGQASVKVVEIPCPSQKSKS